MIQTLVCCHSMYGKGSMKFMDVISLFPFQALLLLNQLTRNNANIQKIVAFENAFERLLDIIREEGGIDGGKLILNI